MSHRSSWATTRCGPDHVLDGVTANPMGIADDGSICATGRV